MKTHAEMKQHIVKYAVENDKFHYYSLLENGKVPDEIIELERLFLNEFYRGNDFDE